MSPFAAIRSKLRDLREEIAFREALQRFSAGESRCDSKESAVRMIFASAAVLCCTFFVPIFILSTSGVNKNLKSLDASREGVVKALCGWHDKLAKQAVRLETAAQVAGLETAASPKRPPSSATDDVAVICNKYRPQPQASLH